MMPWWIWGLGGYLIGFVILGLLAMLINWVLR